MKLTSEVVEHLEAFSLFQSETEFEQHMEGWLQQVRVTSFSPLTHGMSRANPLRTSKYNGRNPT